MHCFPFPALDLRDSSGGIHEHGSRMMTMPKPWPPEFVMRLHSGTRCSLPYQQTRHESSTILYHINALGPPGLSMDALTLLLRASIQLADLAAQPPRKRVLQIASTCCPSRVCLASFNTVPEPGTMITDHFCLKT